MVEKQKKYSDEADLVGKNSALITYFKNGQEFKQNFETIRETIDETL